MGIILSFVRSILSYPKLFYDIHSPGSSWRPKSQVEIAEVEQHVRYGEMVSAVYDTLDSNERSVTFTSSFFDSDDKTKEFIAGIFPNYTIVDILVSSSNSFGGKEGGNVDDAYMGYIAYEPIKEELVVVFRGTILKPEWAEDSRVFGFFIFTLFIHLI
jgi:hypothetical protein